MYGSPLHAQPYGKVKPRRLSQSATLCARNVTIIIAYTLQLPQPEPSTLPHNTDAGWQHSRPDVTPDAHHHRRVRTQDAGHRTKHTHAQAKAAVSNKNTSLCARNAANHNTLCRLTHHLVVGE